MSRVPKIIHQSYKTDTHPYPAEWQKSWLDQNPGWEYRFYSDEDNRALVQAHFPKFLDAFDAFPLGIMKADFTRFLYLYLYGGVYADLDYVCLRPLDPLIARVEHVGVPTLPHNKYCDYHNAFLVSEPRNEFWLRCAEHAVDYFTTTAQPRVELLAGPLRIKQELAFRSIDFEPLSQELVTPIDWYEIVIWGKPNLRTAKTVRQLRGAAVADIRDVFPSAFAITLWYHGWNEPKAT